MRQVAVLAHRLSGSRADHKASSNKNSRGSVCLSLLAVVLAAAVAALGSAPAVSASTTEPGSVTVIVRQAPGAGDAPERSLARLGGRVVRQLGLVDGFLAAVPRPALGQLAASAGVRSVTPDTTVRLLDDEWDDDHGNDWDDKHDGDENAPALNATSDMGSVYNTTKMIGANSLWGRGITGRGVDVAVIDTGVVPVNGLRTPGKIINGADLSFESQSDALRSLDTNGHGTHMAGIIAGRDDTYFGSEKEPFVGVAPDARIVNVKVGAASGAVDVSQVIAAIDWVVAHRRDNGMNIRVLNLSFGTDGVQDYLLDPLTYAAEVAWRKGLVVVVAAGNRGTADSRMTNPATDPYLLAVGASDPRSTLSTSDDVVADFSSRGDLLRGPDLLAPGKSTVALRNPGSNVDLEHPLSVVAGRFTRGSGTSQAAAVVSGAAALLLQQRPTLSPDQVKALLRTTATRLPRGDVQGQGKGLVNLAKASQTTPPSTTTARQVFSTATGRGSLEGARGTAHVVADGVELVGEQDIFANPWDGPMWSQNSWDATSWNAGSWNGNDWTGSTWTVNPLGVQTWEGRMWSGRMWSGDAWGIDGASTNTWEGRMWSGRMWSGDTWSGRMWSGRMWSEALPG